MVFCKAIRFCLLYICSYTGNQRAQTWCTNGRCRYTLIFADDVLTSDTNENVQNLFNVTAHWCTSWKLCVNMEKAKVVHSRNSRSSCTATLTGPAVATCRSTSDSPDVICIKGCQTWFVPREVPSSHATMTSELPSPCCTAAIAVRPLTYQQPEPQLRKQLKFTSGAAASTSPFFWLLLSRSLIPTFNFDKRDTLSIPRRTVHVCCTIPMWTILNLASFYTYFKLIQYIGALVRDCKNYIINALELLQSCDEPFMFSLIGDGSSSKAFRGSTDISLCFHVLFYCLLCFFFARVKCAIVSLKISLPLFRIYEQGNNETKR